MDSQAHWRLMDALRKNADYQTALRREAQLCATMAWWFAWRLAWLLAKVIELRDAGRA